MERNIREFKSIEELLEVAKNEAQSCNEDIPNRLIACVINHSKFEASTLVKANVQANGNLKIELNHDVICDQVIDGQVDNDIANVFALYCDIEYNFYCKMNVCDCEDEVIESINTMCEHEYLDIKINDEEDFEDIFDELDDSVKLALINDYLGHINDYENTIYCMEDLNEHFCNRSVREIFEIAQREKDFDIEHEYFKDYIDLESSNDLEDLFDIDDDEFKEYVLNHYREYTRR